MSKKFYLKHKKDCYYVATESGCEHAEIFTDDEKEAQWYVDAINAIVDMPHKNDVIKAHEYMETGAPMKDVLDDWQIREIISFIAKALS